MSVPPSQARVEGGGVKAEEDTPPQESYHTATATIFMTDSLRHWQKLTRGVPLSPMRPSMMPGGARTQAYHGCHIPRCRRASHRHCRHTLVAKWAQGHVRMVSLLCQRTSCLYVLPLREVTGEGRGVSTGDRLPDGSQHHLVTTRIPEALAPLRT